MDVSNWYGGATIRNPDCTLTGKINMSEMTGWSWDALERAKWKGCAEPQVKPSDIRKLIENINKGVYEIRTTSTEDKTKAQAQAKNALRKQLSGD